MILARFFFVFFSHFFSVFSEPPPTLTPSVGLVRFVSGGGGDGRSPWFCFEVEMTLSGSFLPYRFLFTFHFFFFS